MQDETEENKLNLLINHIDAAVYEQISEAAIYNEAIDFLSNTYAKTLSPVFARYTLMSFKQQTGELLDVYFQKLRHLSVDCDFQAVSAQVHKKEAIGDAFIGDIISSYIRQRLLENNDLTLQAAFDKKNTLLDAYPLPRMRDVVQKVARYKVYFTLDLTSAYHQVKLPPSDRTYKALEADNAFGNRNAYLLNSPMQFLVFKE